MVISVLKRGRGEPGCTYANFGARIAAKYYSDWLEQFGCINGVPHACDEALAPSGQLRSPASQTCSVKTTLSLLRSQHQIRHLDNQHTKNMSVWLLNSVFEGAFPLADLIASNFGFPMLLPGLNNDATSQLAATLWKLSCVCFCGVPSVLAWSSGKSNRSLAVGSFVYHSILVWISIQSFRGVGGMPVGPWIFSKAADNQTLLSVLQGGVHGLMAFLFLQHLQG